MNKNVIDKYLPPYKINKKGSGKYKKWLGKLDLSPKKEPP